MKKKEQKTIKGSEFKKENKSTFYFLGDKNTNLGIQYENLISITIEIEELYSFFHPYICYNNYTHICEIEIPDDALIEIVRYGTFGTFINNFNVISKILFQDFFETLNDTEKIMTLKTSKVNTFRFMNPNLITDKIRTTAVRNKGDLILTMIDLPIKSLEKICIVAVKNNGENIQYIYQMISTKPSISSILTENLKMLAVKQEPASIKYIEDPSEFLKIEAISKKGDLIQYIKNPSEEVKTAAIKAKVKHIKTELGSLELITELVEKDTELKIYEAMCYFKDDLDEKNLITLGTHGFGIFIKYMKNITDDILFKIIDKKFNSIHGIKNPSEDFLLKVITIKPQIISFKKKLSQEFYLKAVKINHMCILYINNPSVEIQMEVVKSNPEHIKHIKNPYKEAQMEAIKLNPKYIEFIKNPCKEALEYVKK